MEKRRILGLDIVRFIAIFLVISLHSIMIQGYYNQPLNSLGMFLILLVSWAFYICVPLFLLLTGYLNGKAKPDRNYFLKISRILISWFIIAFICLFVRNYFAGEHLSITQCFSGLFNFTADPYGWYVEMYIGLFLLIPFLNIIYDNLKGKTIKVLICILLFMTAISPIINGIYFHNVRLDVIPDYWVIIYPLTYYFVGRYLKDNPLKMKDRTKVLTIVTLLLVQTLLTYFYAGGEKFNWGFMAGYGNLFTLVITILIFSLFCNKNIKNEIVSKSISKISLVSFEMYLISYAFDIIFYKLFALPYDYSSSHFVINYLMLTPLVFICSFFAAWLINWISERGYRKLKDLVNNKFNQGIV